MTKHLQPTARKSVQRKTKLMTSGINADIGAKDKKLETVRSFKYLGAIIVDEGSKPELLSRIAQTTAVLIKTKDHME